MKEVSEEYSLLFNAVTDALDAMTEQDWVRAQALLMRAQQRAERMYIEEG